MTPTMPRDDAVLEAMLARRASRARPDGLRTSILAAVEQAPQVRRPLFGGWPFGAQGVTSGLGPSLRPAWILVAAGLLLALLAGLMIVGASLLERPRPLEPLRYATGIEATTGGNDWWSAKTDVDGNVWAYSPGHLARVDSVTGEIRAWSVGDDHAFASNGVTPARDGGVWVIGKTTLSRFDGQRLRTVVDAPGYAAAGEIWGLAETPDGSLWAALGALGVRRWDGTVWATVGEDAPRMFATFLEVDDRGRVWAGGEGGGVSVFDGTRWTTYPGSGGALASQHTVRFIAVEPDGATWVGTDFGVARLDGGKWTDLTADITDAAGASPGGLGCLSIAFAADGTAWVAFLATTESGPMADHVARFDGQTWTAYGPAEGLPADSYAAWITTGPDGVFVATSPGLYRLEGGRWVRAWPPVKQPGLIRQLLAISRDEAWAATDTGTFRYGDGAWVLDDPNPSDPGSGRPGSLAVAPDGTPWVGGYHGLAVREGDRWTIVPGVQNGAALAFAPDGTLWVADSHYPADQLEVFSMAGGGRQMGLDAVEPSPLGWVSSLAVGRDGILWAGSDGFSAGETAGLARFDGRRWERVRPLGTIDAPVTSVTVAANGDVWVRLSQSGEGSVARFDGERWTVYGVADGLSRLEQTMYSNLAAGPDGTVWVPTSNGLARFDGERWTVRDQGVEFGQVSIATDGTVWASGTGGILRIVTADDG